MPYALMMGVTYRDFWEMNPRIIKFYAERYKNKRNEEDLKQWQLGQYITAAISTIGKGKYPKKPLFQIEGNTGEITEKNIQKAILAEQQYMAMAVNKGLPKTIIK